MSAAGTPPGLSNRTRPFSTLTMVDSTPTGVEPPSTTSGMRPPRSAATASALVAETRPDELALGAASGRPVAAMSFAAKPTGMRRPTVSSPAVTSGLTAAPSRSGTTRVSGPGQKASASFRDRGSRTPMRSAIARSATWTISGLKRGRPLAS